MLLTIRTVVQRLVPSFVPGIAAGVLLTLATASIASCARSPLKREEGLVDPYLCASDADCLGGDACQIKQCREGLCFLVRTLSCDDNNPCTTDSCNSSDGSCINRRRTSDEDGDGFSAPLPGKQPGDADACGDDCNDTSALSHPGAKEACDGVDNDCNGIVDDRYQYQSQSLDALPTATLVSSTSEHEAIPAGLAFDGQKFAMTVVERNERWQSVFHAFDAKAQSVVEPTLLAKTASDAIAGPLVWTGSLYGTVWEDRRQESYDIYFNRLDVYGQKLAADLRVTDSSGFSIEPSLLYDGGEWLLAYADENDYHEFGIFVQRISKDAALVGNAVEIASAGYDAHQPRLSRNNAGLGVFFKSVVEDQFMFMRLDNGLNVTSAPIPLELDQPGDVTIRWNGDRYILAWDKRTDTGVGDSIWAMSLDAFGSVIDSPRPITVGASIARGPSIVTMGDRFVLLWADDRYTPGLFEVTLQMFDNAFTPLGVQEQVSDLHSDSIDPSAVLGGGSLGVLFRSRKYGEWEAFFLAIGCWYPPSD